MAELTRETWQALAFGNFDKIPVKILSQTLYYTIIHSSSFYQITREMSFILTLSIYLRGIQGAYQARPGQARPCLVSALTITLTLLNPPMHATRITPQKLG